MAKKKRKSQNLSKRKQAELLRKQGYSYKEINRMKSSNREQISELIIADNKVKKQNKQLEKTIQKAPKKKAYDTYKTRVSNKRLALHNLGFDNVMQRGLISDKKIDSIRLSDIENGTITREKYSFLFYGTFDFNQIYTLKDNQRMYVAFRDYQGELDFAELLQRYSRYTDNELVDGLESIVNTPPTYKKGVTGSSSGRAGDYKFMVAPQEVIKAFNNENNKKSRRGKNKRRMHSQGEKVGFQVMKNGRLNSHSEVTPRNLLIMANALMYNITEQERGNFYSRFYTDIIKHIPDMKEILPKPKF